MIGLKIRIKKLIDLNLGVYQRLVLILCFSLLLYVELSSQDSTQTMKRRQVELDFSEIESEGNYWKRTLFSSPMLFIDSVNFQFALTGIWDGELGKAEGERTYQNTRGALIQGQFKDKVVFASSIYENQSFAPDFVDDYVNETYVYPGGTRIKSFKVGGFDYYYASSYLNYKPSRYFQLEVGHGKHFIGEGYRSLLLSDNAFNYPYLKLQTDFWKIKYTNLYAELMDFYNSGNSDQLFQKKYFSTHTLDFKVADWLNVALFETVVWEAGDTINPRGIELQYLNPVIFFRPVEFSVGSPDNVMMGMNIKSTPINGLTLYGQVILDEFLLSEIKAKSGWWANKYGGQIGAKYQLEIDNHKLFGLAEYNIVRPFTYTHFNQYNNYAHYNQALAHPRGANFKELVLKGRYEFKGAYLEGKLNMLTYGADDPADSLSYGGDLFVSYNYHAKEYGNFIGQGIENLINFYEVKWGYVINPVTNMRLEVGLLRRDHTVNDVNTVTNWFTFGFKTLMPNRYFDFL